LKAIEAKGKSWVEKQTKNFDGFLQSVAALIRKSVSASLIQEVVAMITAKKV